MSTQRLAGNYASAIQQRIATGHFFDGTLPAGDSPQSGLVYKFDPANAGGLFFWQNYNESIICSQFHIDLGGGTGDISLFLVNIDPPTIKGATPTPLVGESILIEQATGVRSLALDEARFKVVMLPYQALQLITTASANPQIAQAVGAIERTYIR